MKKYIPFVNSSNNGIQIEQTSVECPYCHKIHIPEMYSAILYKDFNECFIFCECIDKDCGFAFTRIYNISKDEFIDIIQAKLISKEFSYAINNLSPSFVQIYNEAYSAEQMNLSQIMGVGYRKALEFLIKDYLISLDPDKEVNIKAKPLGRCIDEDIDDAKIKNVAVRATWLGNDETHYVRKWVDKDVTHLKALIDLCLHWIEAETSTKQLLEDMPKGGK